MNTELLFQTVQTVNQLSVYGAVTSWCEQFGLDVDNKILTMVEPEEVELLVSLPTQAPGNRLQGSVLSFKALENIQLTQLCEKSLLPTSFDSRGK